MGFADAFGGGVQAVNGLYNGQLLRDQLQTYPQLLQAQLQQNQNAAGISGVQLQYAPQLAQADLLKQNLANQYYGPTAQANIGLTNAQAGQAGANAGYIGTEAAKNQFLINNPGLMLPGMPGQLSGINYLQQHDPSMFASGAAPQSGGMAAPLAGAAAQNTMPLPASSGMAAPIAPINSVPLPVANNATPLGAPALAQPGMNAGMGGNMFGGNPLANRMVNSIFAPLNKDVAQTNMYNARASGFNQLPPDGKAQVISQTNAFGYSPEEAGQLLSQGYSVQQLGAAKGYTDPNNYPPGDPSPTAETRTRTNLRNSSMAELDNLQPQITQALSPFAQRVGGYSPAQIGQAISGSDPDSQARFLAAKALTPDINALRTKIAGGQFGIGMNEELAEQAQNNFKAFEGLVTPQVYAKAQSYMQQWLSQANSAANKAIYTAPSTQAAQSQSAPKVQQFNNADLAYTAKKYNMTIAQVKQKLGVQ